MKFFLLGGARLCRALTLPAIVVLLSIVASHCFAFSAAAQTTNGLSKAEIQGRQLAQEILQARPITNFTQTGVLTVRNPGGTTNIPVTFLTFVTPEDWKVDYFAKPTNKSSAYVYGASDHLHVIHKDGLTNVYFLTHRDGYHSPDEVPISDLRAIRYLSSSETMAPFADSDFWIADLGLEFFHWPDQKILRHEDRRTRACAVLESTNPNPSPGAYSRVVSWIDNETLGIVWAEAYDNNGKLLKEFDPKRVKKVNGLWQLEEMEIRNVQTKSRSSIKFDLNSK